MRAFAPLGFFRSACGAARDCENIGPIHNAGSGAELAELEVAGAQYEHYRNHLLSMTALKQRCGGKAGVS